MYINACFNAPAVCEEELGNDVGFNGIYQLPQKTSQTGASCLTPMELLQLQPLGSSRSAPPPPV